MNDVHRVDLTARELIDQCIDHLARVLCSRLVGNIDAARRYRPTDVLEVAKSFLADNVQLNFGSFSMGSQGILKSTNAGATWTLFGANVFGPGLPLPAGQYPQYQAVGKVRVDPRNSNNIVAGTKTGLFFSYDGGNNWTGPCTTNNYNTMRQDITGLALSNTGSSTRIIAAVGVRGFATTVQYNLDQNGANGIYKGTLPASGCPSDFTSIATISVVFSTRISISIEPCSSCP